MITRIILFLVLVLPHLASAQNSCQNLFSRQQLILDRKALVEQDLSNVYADETAGKTATEIAEMNQKTIESIEGELPEKDTSTRAVSITDTAANRLLKLTLENPVVNPGNPKYDQPNVSIGYCFGRATFIHLMLLKMGLQKNSIRKIWAVGPMKAGGLTWQFHVATMAYTNKGWIVIDTNHYAPITPREWMAHYGKQSEDGRVRFYATDASKFAFELGKYSRVQMGLDLTADKDWYRNYFRDMVEWVKERRLSEDGIVSVEKQSSETKSVLNMTMSDMWSSIVEFLR